MVLDYDDLLLRKMWKNKIKFTVSAYNTWKSNVEKWWFLAIIPLINLIFFVSNKEEAAFQYLFLFLFLLLLSVSPSFPLLLSVPPSCGIMGIVQVAWRSTLCPRRSRRRRAVMTCSTARSPSSPSQLIPALRSSVVVVGAMWVWAPSLELLVMCLAAVPILPLLPFHCRYHVCFKDASLCFSCLLEWLTLSVKVHPVCVFIHQGSRKHMNIPFTCVTWKGIFWAGYFTTKTTLGNVQCTVTL